MQAFKDLGLHEDLVKGIEQLGFSTPTPVQALVIPTALTTEGDFTALAQTGTGKTAAFGLPLLQLIDPNVRSVQALVLCPTRELCVQVASDLENYSRFSRMVKVVAVYGGASIERQMSQLKNGANVVVATPGRLIDLLHRNAIKLENLARLVLDEADEMLNMGFKDDLDTILAAATSKKSVWLFSATMSNEIRAISKNYMTDPVELSVGGRNEANVNIEHVYYLCRADDRYLALKRIVDAHPGIYGLIFCRTKADTKEIADQMNRDGYNSDALHGDLSQNERDRVMNRFRDGSLQLLIATDVAARGIDVDGISHVIHYGLPDDIEVYTHRSGRTGRAGKKGTSITIVSAKFESRLRDIERMAKVQFKKLPLPSGEEVCEQQLLHIIHNIRQTEVKHSEIEPFMPQILAELQDLSKEELIIRFASVEFNRFLSYYKNAPDLNVYPKSLKSTFGTNGRAENFKRLFASIGEMDGVTKKEFMSMLTNEFKVPMSAIGTIDIKKAYMHFDLEAPFVKQVSEKFAELRINGRRVRVDDASPSRKEGGAPRREGGREGSYGGKREGGGYGGAKREGGYASKDNYAGKPKKKKYAF